MSRGISVRVNLNFLQFIHYSAFRGRMKKGEFTIFKIMAAVNDVLSKGKFMG